ncbi:hypothetical protein TIFTF001_046875 [Ficus carica]|uniref:Uncharacterized protein n=1 Tax=Ficus carica TaxID=3494 RepID=A0AA88CJS0_FICCA|nr:hypothetical protein TIFTF001_046875 [Ficus carica]
MALPQVHMISSVSHDEDFPPIYPATTIDGKETRQPKVYNPKTMNQTGLLRSTVPWQFATIPKMEQPLPLVPNIEDHVLRLKKLLDQDDALRKLKLPQIRLQQLNTFSEEESALEDSDWSSKALEPEKSATPQPIMMNQPADEPTVTEIPDSEEHGDEKPNAQSRQILLDFVSRFAGILQDWWMSLGEYRQLIFLQTNSVEGALAQLYSEFCGEENQIVEQARSEYFKMKCCSIHKKDLEVHFQKVSRRFYLIGGLNDPNLKQAFLSSIPEPPGEETFRLLSAANKKITDTTFRELCQLILKAIDKMCSLNKFLQKHIKHTKNFDKVCTNKELYTKCPNNSTPGCTCASCSSKPPPKTRKFRRKKCS